MRARHLSPRTERAYVGWIVRYIRYHGTRHPRAMGEEQVVAYLTHLADARRVSRSTQMQALSALMLLYREVLGVALPDLRRVLRSTTPMHLPAVLTRAEVAAVLSQLPGTAHLIDLLLYGAGLRLLECLTLRVKDVDLARREIRLRRGKGGKDRVTMLPSVAVAALEAQLERVRALHARDVIGMWPLGRSGGTTHTRRRCSARCIRPSSARESRSGRRATRCGTRSRRISWRTGTTSAR